MRPPASLRRPLTALLALGLGLLGVPAGGQPPPPGWLGISIADVGEELADRLAATHGYAAGVGVQVLDLLEGGPAEQGALRRGDVIVEADGQPIWEAQQLQRLVRARPVDRPLTLVVLRETGRQRVTVRVGAMPAEARAQLAALRFGFRVRPAGEPEGTAPSAARLVVTAVEFDSAAHRAGLRPFDLLLEANGLPLADLAAFERAVGDGEALRLQVARRDLPAPLALILTPIRR